MDHLKRRGPFYVVTEDIWVPRKSPTSNDVDDDDDDNLNHHPSKMMMTLLQHLHKLRRSTRHYRH